jgi:protein-S-isoprenylcysteine O-methyltransferase Ste14
MALRTAAVPVAAHLALLALPPLAVGGRVDAVLGLLWALGLGLQLVEMWALPAARPAVEDLGSARLAALGLLSVFWIGGIEHSWSGASARPGWAVAGLLAGAAGIALRGAAMRRLHERFLDSAELLPGHRLETAGPYALLRHPAEVGLLALAAGAALLCSSPLAASVGFVVLGPAAIRRARREDGRLEQRFGAEYEAYRRRVPGLGR